MKSTTSGSTQKAPLLRGWRLFVITIVLSLILLFSFVGFIYSRFYSRVQKDALTSANDKLNIASEYANAFLTKAENVVNSMSTTVEFMMASGVSNADILEYLIYETDHSLALIDENYTGIYGYYRGEYLDGNRWDPWADGGEYDPTVRPWYVDAKNGGGKAVIVSPYLDLDTGNVVLSVSRMLPDGESVFGLDITLNEFRGYADQLITGGTEYAFILDASGIIVSAAGTDEDVKNVIGLNYFEDDSEDSLGLLPLFETALSSDKSFNYTIGGKDCLVLSKTINSNWQVVEVLDPDNVYEFLHTTVIGVLALITLLLLVIGFYTYRSVLERRREKESAELSKKQLSIIQSISNDYEAIYYVDLKTGHYDVYTNIQKETDNLLRKLNYANDFFADSLRNLDLVVYEEDRAVFADFINRDNLLRNLSDQHEIRLRFRQYVNGLPEYYELRCIRPQDEESGDRLIFGSHNINTLVKEQAAQNTRLSEALHKAQASDRSKTTFLFNMSHDIRTPMNAIIGFTDMARKHIDDNERVSDCLEKVAAAGNHLLGLINDVLDMARIESGKVTLNEVPMNIRKASLATMTIAVSEGKRKNVDVVLRESSLGDKMIYGDELRINQIAMNILSNAIKYTNSGGRVDVRVDELPESDPGYLRCRLVVADTGIGMKPEFVKTIFEPFEREKTSTESGVQGTGLGMSIVKSLVDMMGGDIGIESEPGKGTTVTITFRFRLAEENTAERADKTVIEDTISLKGRRVLLVEDNELNREIATDILQEELGLTVETAEDGTIAVDRMQKMGPDYVDFILMDIQMPRMNGYEATKQIREMYPDRHIPIIALSANAFAEDKQKSLEAGMDDHIEKPIDVGHLFAAISRFV